MYKLPCDEHVSIEENSLSNFAGNQACSKILNDKNGINKTKKHLTSKFTDFETHWSFSFSNDETISVFTSYSSNIATRVDQAKHGLN